MPTDKVDSAIAPGHLPTFGGSHPEWRSLVSSVAPSTVSDDAVDEFVEQLTQAITQQVIAQQQQKMATLIHDLRHPLAAILGVADLVLTDSLSEPQRERIEMMKTTCDGLMDLVVQALESEGQSMETPEAASEAEASAVDVDQLIHEVLREAAYASQQPPLDLFYYRPKHVPRYVQVDRVAVKQLLGNLISNAVKFTQEGSVSVHVNQVCVDDQDHLHLVVEDTGPGIPQGMQNQIFHRYVQVDGEDARGVGLGLAICKQIAEQLNGQVWAESRLGSGSRFHLTIPFVNDIAMGSQSNSMVPGALAGHRALLVSASSRQAQVLRYVLNDIGVHVDFARLDDFRAILAAGSMESLGYDSLIINADQTMGDLAPLLQIQLNADCSVVWLGMIGQECASDARLDHVLTKPVFYDELATALATGSITVNDMTERGSAKRMLIVDDSEINLMISAGVFESEGHHVDLLANGSEVVSALEKQRYDLILLDVEMPGMDGFETAVAVRHFELTQGRDRIPIVAMTAHDTSWIAERAAQHGIDVCLRKPLDSTVLWNALKEFEATGYRRPTARLDSHAVDDREVGPRIRKMQLHPLNKIRQ